MPKPNNDARITVRIPETFDGWLKGFADERGMSQAAYVRYLMLRHVREELAKRARETKAVARGRALAQKR